MIKSCIKLAVATGLPVIVFITLMGCGGSRDIAEETAAETSLNQMRVIDSEIVGWRITNQSESIIDVVQGLAQRKGSDFFRCYEDTNLWVCIRPNKDYFASNPQDLNQLIMYTPILFTTNHTNQSFFVGLLASGNGTNLISRPSWQPVPVWQLLSSNKSSSQP